MSIKSRRIMRANEKANNRISSIGKGSSILHTSDGSRCENSIIIHGCVTKLRNFHNSKLLELLTTDNISIPWESRWKGKSNRISSLRDNLIFEMLRD